MHIIIKYNSPSQFYLKIFVFLCYFFDYFSIIFGYLEYQLDTIFNQKPSSKFLLLLCIENVKDTKRQKKNTHIIVKLGNTFIAPLRFKI